jgi:hypothetical protein
LTALSVGTAPALAAGNGGGQSGLCHLQSLGNKIQHVVHLQFDNVHFRRDNPNVPSDLEQMPHLLNFLKGNGTLFTNHHTPLISHTAVDILTTLTGVYGNKFGVPIGNSLRRFNPDGTTSGVSSFAYWTDPVDIFSGEVPANPPPQMIDQRGKIHPAPWVPFTRAGCDVGAFSTANIEFENVTIDVDTVFGPTSPQHAEAHSNPTKAVADFEGIAVHCARNSQLCAKNAGPDVLNDEPGGYIGFTALYGNANVQPQISPNGPVKDLDGNVIADNSTPPNPGFPGFSPTASQSLGYVATMLEAGVPVVYLYIADAHDNRGQSLSGVDPKVQATFGPGEQGYVNQLAAYDKAFDTFFTRLAKNGITQENTLFVATSDENDHFAGGPPSPPNCDGVEVPCTYAKIGEIDANLTKVFFTEFNEATPFTVHSDDAPTFYIQGNPGQTDGVTRRFEQEAGQAKGFDPLDLSQGPNGSTNQLAQALADQSEQDLLHMITSDPARTPNFILFGNPDYFLFASGSPALCNKAVPSDFTSCFIEEGPKGFAWNHGDYQNDIVQTWLGMVGPGVQPLGEFGSVFSDHTDIRPTILRLVGLKDDYAHDGRVLFEALNHEAAGGSLRAHQDTLSELAAAYKAINAPVGELGLRTLTGISTTATSGNDATYAALSAQIKAITAKRNQIAGQMIAMLEAAAFDNQPIDEAAAASLIKQAHDLLASVP